MSHIALARFDNADDIDLDCFGTPLTSLFTIAAEYASRPFDLATHGRGGQQKEGLDIFDWGMVNFDEEYRGERICEAFRAMYRDLCAMVSSSAASAQPSGA
ncbi:hypothetical protein EK21DRAFT_118864 [Setomelanomma holmii]|uniref:Uncharacterized protein n=1 Tax=Setomelanomma holmii TaxID=210430 RepID=A0A9P4GXM9_9PLEO|nr:hypothetical protein EK21DRAFT_118864 [Setomelanomma holmii]